MKIPLSLPSCTDEQLLHPHTWQLTASTTERLGQADTSGAEDTNRPESMMPYSNRTKHEGRGHPTLARNETCSTEELPRDRYDHFSRGSLKLDPKKKIKCATSSGRSTSNHCSCGATRTTRKAMTTGPHQEKHNNQNNDHEANFTIHIATHESTPTALHCG